MTWSVESATNTHVKMQPEHASTFSNRFEVRTGMRSPTTAVSLWIGACRSPAAPQHPPSTQKHGQQVRDGTCERSRRGSGVGRRRRRFQTST